MDTLLYDYIPVTSTYIQGSITLVFHTVLILIGQGYLTIWLHTSNTMIDTPVGQGIIVSLVQVFQYILPII